MIMETIQVSRKQIMLEDCLCSECINQSECEFKGYRCPAWRFLDWLLAEKGVELFLNAWEKEASE